MQNKEHKMKVMRTHKREDTVVKIGDIAVGGNKLVVMAGPCSVESREQILDIAKHVKEMGASVLRGGAWKPRSSPYSFQGLKESGIELLYEAKKQTGLPIISEITSPNHIEKFMGKVDCFQVGARNMQNFELLTELGKINVPILLKRGFAYTIKEFLLSAEYILKGGNEGVILCERGIRANESYTRYTLDISAIPIVKRLSHLPILVDPSHASGKAWMVESLSMAAVAAGADGLLIEVHDNPEEALCDGPQSVNYDMFRILMEKVERIGQVVGREI